MPLDLRHLRSFIAVAEELNFHRAADRIGIVQPAISRHISDLEAEVGAALLTRSTRSVALTDAGKVFLGEARAVLAQIDQAVRSARQVATGAAGELSIGYMDFAVHRILPSLLTAMRAAEPGIRIDLQFLPTGEQRSALMERRIDAGLMIGGMAGPAMGTRVIERLPLVAVLPTAHRLAQRPSLALADLAGLPLVLGSQRDWFAFREIVSGFFARAGVTPSIVQEAATAPAIFALVAAAFGATLYAGAPDRYLSRDIRVIDIDDAPEVTIHLAWRRDHKPELIRRLLAALDKN